MAGRECYHCKQWVAEGEAHDCWTTTEAALTADLSEDLREAWERLRETAAAFGEQRIYASHQSIMFSRKACYFFVRPKRSYLELCVFMGRAVAAPQIRRAVPSSKTRFAHLIRVKHRDEVEAPITDWLQEAYALQDVLAQRTVEQRAASTNTASARRRATSPRKAKKTTAAVQKTHHKTRPVKPRKG